MSLDAAILSNLRKYKILAIVGVFVSFFVVVGLLNYFQRVTLEGFVSLKENEHFSNKEKFGHCNKTHTEGFAGCPYKNK